MPDKAYEQLQALVVDDFDSFRVALTKMLQNMGIGKVDAACSSNEALRYCATKAYDIILSDHNLGQGKTGQQLLELLRHEPNVNSDSLFFLVSAESNKNIIIAAYDYEPDAYLTKPITAKTLEQRISRLLAQRSLLAPVYAALKDNQLDHAITLCEAEIANHNRHTGICQKMLGKLLLQAERFADAENLFRDLLEVRQLDWAMLGMATVKIRLGDLLSAQQWLEEIIQFNPLCLKAYDLLADIMQERRDYAEQQNIMQLAVEISPLSILRQQQLGHVAQKNNDSLSAASAYRKAVRLGENSCHENISTHENFIHAAVMVAKEESTAAKPLLRDALKVAMDIPENFGKTHSNRVKAYLFESQVHWVSGDKKNSKEALFSAQKLLDTQRANLSIEAKIEFVKTLREQSKQLDSENLVADLLVEYEGKEDELQKIDCLLDEPCSAKNKAIVAAINKEGIAFYEAKEFDRAVHAFTNALHDFPKHIGLRLNLVQALIGSCSQTAEKSLYLSQINQILAYVGKVISNQHAQYQRYRQLDDLAQQLSASNPSLG